MNRDRVLPVVLAALAVLALGLGAASIDPATRSGGGSGSGGFIGDGSTFDLGRSAPTEPTDGPVIPKLVFRLLAAALLVSFPVGLYVLRDELDRRTLGIVVVLSVAFVGVLLALYVLFRFFGSEDAMGGEGGFLGERAPALPGGGGVGEPANPLSIDPLFAFAFVLVALVLVAAAVVFRSGDETEDAKPNPEPTTAGSLPGIGRAAGRAADRIAAERAVENEVYRAWREMADRLDVTNPQSSTPGEFARAAIDAGMAREDVDELTVLFRAVRYGGRAVTADRETRAVAALRHIEAEYTEGP